MALVNKLKQNEVVQQTAQPQSSSNVTETKSQAAKPIDMKVDKPADESKKNSEILDYLNSDKFKELSPEEQLKAFKEKYGLGLSDEEVGKLFTNAKKVAAEFSQRTALEAGEETPTANVVSSNDTVKAEIDAKKEIIEILKQQGIEKPTQSDLFNYLTTQKANGAELSAEQAKLLKTFNALLDNGFEGLKGPAQEKTATLIPIEEVISSENLHKSSEELIRMYMDAYLTKHDSEYTKLSAEEKLNYFNERAEQLSENISNGETLQSLKDKITAYKAMAVLEAAHAKDEKITDFSDKSLAKSADAAINNQIKVGINTLLNDKGLKDKTPEEQMLAIGNLIFAKDEKFAKLSDSKKMRYIENKLQEVCDKVGIPFRISSNNPKVRKLAIDALSGILTEFASTGEDVTIESYLKTLKDPLKRTQILIKNTKDEKIRAYYQKNMEIYMEMENHGVDLNKPSEIAAYLKGKDPETLSPNEKRILKEAMNSQLIDEKKSVALAQYDAQAILIEEMKGNLTPDEILKTGLEGCKTKEEQAAFLAAYFEKFEDSQLRAKVTEMAKKLNIQEDFEFIAMVKSTARDDGAGAGQIAASNPESKASKAVMANGAKLMTRDANIEMGTEIVKNDKASKLYSQALQNRDNYTQEEVLYISKGILKSDNVSDANSSKFSKLLIENANNPEEQLTFAKEYTSLGRASVTEGVAAAGNSIPPSSKSQFNNIISQAVSSGNYSSNEVANINNALQTGRISNETLAKTTPPSAAATNPAANAPAKSASAPSNTGNVPAQRAAGDQAVAQSGGLQTPVQPVSVEPKLQAAQIRNDSAFSSVKSNSSVSRQEAMQNAAETKSSIDKSVKDWEDKHNAKLSDEEIKALKSSAAAAVISDIIGDDKASLNSKEAVAQILQNASNINELYSTLVSLYGSKVQNKFVESLASFGSAAQIHSFAENSGNKDVIKNLYMRCGSSGLKNELLGLLPPSSVYEMLSARQIHDLSSVDYKVLKEYVIKNLSHMSNTEFNNYLKFLPFDERQALVKLRANDTPLTGNEVGEIGAYAKNLKTENDTANTVLPGSDEWAEQNRARQSGVKVPPSSVYATYTAVDALSDWDGFGSSKVPFGRNYDKQKRSHVYWG